MTRPTRTSRHLGTRYLLRANGLPERMVSMAAPVAITQAETIVDVPKYLRVQMCRLRSANKYMREYGAGNLARLKLFLI